MARKPEPDLEKPLRRAMIWLLKRELARKKEHEAHHRSVFH
jgi:hypothetical protein